MNPVHRLLLGVPECIGIGLVWLGVHLQGLLLQSRRAIAIQNMGWYRASPVRSTLQMKRQPRYAKGWSVVMKHLLPRIE
jgi:hypothetical protein